MKPSTREWVEKAESDYQLALALSRRRKVTFPDQQCFHCQQSAEKYLKARLEEANILPPKTHDLKKLLGMLVPLEPLWSALSGACASLSDFAVEMRYPGDTATAKQAKEALRDAKAIREQVRPALGL
jgi:HEPN domain-containing protein